MNDRIKELAEQVGSTHKQNLGVYQFYTDELEKFAELIVRQCMKICQAHPSIIFKNEWDADVVSPDIVSRLESHFGVKE
jgi:hypothetical protein